MLIATAADDISCVLTFPESRLLYPHENQVLFSLKNNTNTKNVVCCNFVANCTLRDGTEQLQGHTVGNKYERIIFVLVHCF